MSLPESGFRIHRKRFQGSISGHGRSLHIPITVLLLDILSHVTARMAKKAKKGIREIKVKKETVENRDCRDSKERKETKVFQGKPEQTEKAAIHILLTQIVLMEKQTFPYLTPTGIISACMWTAL